jgi:hypothetical protein
MARPRIGCRRSGSWLSTSHDSLPPLKTSVVFQTRPNDPREGEAYWLSLSVGAEDGGAYPQALGERRGEAVFPVDQTAGSM